MDLLKNPFHILGATTRDNRHRILELAEERSLSSDPDVCMAAGKTLTHPRDRVAAEVAWMPGINQTLTNGFLNLLEQSAELRMELFHKLIAFMENVNETGYEQSLFGNEKLIPLSRANLLAAGLSRVHDHLSDNIVQWSNYVFRSSPPTTVRWILEIAKAFDEIEEKEVYITINEERRESSFPEITNLSIIEDELQNRRHYYQQVINLALKDLPIWELEKAVTIGVKIATSNGEKHGPILIDDLVLWYENHIQGSLENVELKINLLAEDIRAMADTERPDSHLDLIINELISTVKENWNGLVQPIQLIRSSRGERHTDSIEIAWRVRELAIHLFNEYGKLDFSRQITNMLKEVFAEVPEIAEQIAEDLIKLEEQGHLAKSMEGFEEINTQVENLKAAADARQPNYTLSPMVNQLIQSIRSWDTTQSVDANSGVAFTVREVALHLCNEHEKLDFAIQITNALIEVFNASSVGAEVVTRLTEDRTTLVGMRSFENINTQVEKLKAAADAYQPNHTLTPLVNQLIQSVRSWNTTTQLDDANNAVAIIGRNIALHLWNEHEKLDFAIQITNALIGVFRGVYGTDEVNQKLSEDIITLQAMDTQRKQATYQQQQRGGTGCLWTIAILVVLAIIGTLLQGC